MVGTLCGYVVRGGRTVVDAAVTVEEGQGQHADMAPLSDSDGWFALDNLVPGRWRLRATAPDGGVGEASVDIWDQTLSEMTIEVGEGDCPRFG